MSHNPDDQSSHESPQMGNTICTFIEHSQWIYTLAWSHNGNRIASAGRDGEILIWDAGTGKGVTTYREKVRWIYSLSWSQIGEEQYLASANSDHTVRVINTTSGKKKSPFKGHKGPVRTVAWSQNGGLIASGGADATVRLWTIDGEELPPYEGHKKTWLHRNINAVAWSPDGKWVASAGDDKTVHIWNAKTRQRNFLSKKHTRTINALAWSPDSKWVASAGNDKKVWLWRFEPEEEFTTFIPHKHIVTAIAWSPDGKKLAFASRKEVLVYDVDTTHSVTTILDARENPFPYPHTSWARAVAWSPKGQLIASAGDDKKVCVWYANEHYVPD